jgi:hypothetical protein
MSFAEKISVLAFLLFVSACERDEPSEDDLPEDPCSLLEEGIYPYPSAPPGSNLTDAEKLEYWNIPEDVLPCLTTEGLLETCLRYPNLGNHLLMVGPEGIQSGYDSVRSMCRGFPELEQRPGALDTLIAKYRSINTVDFDTSLSVDNLSEYGTYDYFTYILEVILGQEVFLENTTMKQKHELLSELFVKQDFREYRDLGLSLEGPAFVMARMMYLDNYQPFMDEYVVNSAVRQTVASGSPTETETRSTIVALAEDYLTLTDPYENLIFKIGDALEYSYYDFELYDSSTHILYFKDYHPEIDSVTDWKWVPFSFHMEGDTLLKGDFWPMTFSSPAPGPYIMSPNLYESYALRFEFRRSATRHDTDPINNARLINDLEEHGLLHSGLSLSMDSSATDGEYLIFYFTVTSHDSQDLLILDIDKMGPELFHYFTNGLIIPNVFHGSIESESPSPWDHRDLEWLSRLKPGESRQFTIHYPFTSSVKPGDYYAFFEFPGLSFYISHEDLYQAEGRIWLGDLLVEGSITFQ